MDGRRDYLLSRLLLDTLSEPYAGAASVFFDEFDASRFESSLYYVERSSTWLVCPRLQVTHRYDADRSFFCEALLTPIEKAPRGPALFRCDHRASMPEMTDSINSIENQLTRRIYLL
jgi:hypothetical protein